MDMAQRVAGDALAPASGQRGRNAAPGDAPRAGLDAVSAAAPRAVEGRARPAAADIVTAEIVMAAAAAAASGTPPVAGTPRPVAAVGSDALPVTRQEDAPTVETPAPRAAAKPRPPERAGAAARPALGHPHEAGSSHHDHAGPAQSGGHDTAKRPGPEASPRVVDSTPQGRGLGPVVGPARDTTPPRPVGPAAAPVAAGPGRLPMPGGKPAAPTAAPDAKPGPDLAPSPEAKPARRPEAAPPAKIEAPKAVIDPRAGQPAQAAHGASERAVLVPNAVSAAVKSYKAHGA
ncbi:hypothetical protein FF100_29960 [Methylobacterium terricola]|uniref:Uncharacterized protein n=1 Tax=Methylobacterium terricola TaxID=2583531 RepID=A0A5C4L852_9HYPH|nr:hypothetical protein FF100_29960 [Methylobacterium terricola]